MRYEVVYHVPVTENQMTDVVYTEFAGMFASGAR
jgi:hypothetical protein